MVRIVNERLREEEIFDLVAESYINQSRPISSAYLCREYNLSYSPATVTHIMLSLEKQGLLSHIHTSSGRVPTQEGFRHYVRRLKEKDITKKFPCRLDFYSLPNLTIEGVVDYALEALVASSGYTSLVAVSGRDERFFFRGMRLILEQPEFEDITRLKDIFWALETRIDDFQNLLFNCIDEDIRILIGDDIGFEETAGCSLVASGLKEKQFMFAVGLLGPIRMNYTKAAGCLYSVRNQLRGIIEEFV